MKGNLEGILLYKGFTKHPDYSEVCFVWIWSRELVKILVSRKIYRL